MTDSHLHRSSSGRPLRRARSEFDTDERDEACFRLADLPTRFGFLYDFGDGWTHDIEALGPGEAQPGCGYGEGRCATADGFAVRPSGWRPTTNASTRHRMLTGDRRRP